MAGFATAAPVLSLVILDDKYFAAFHAECFAVRIYDGTVKRSPASRASFFIFHCCRRWHRTTASPYLTLTSLSAGALYHLSYTAYRCSVCCCITATNQVYTPASPRHPGNHYRDVCQCYS